MIFVEDLHDENCQHESDSFVYRKVQQFCQGLQLMDILKPERSSSTLILEDVSH